MGSCCSKPKTEESTPANAAPQPPPNPPNNLKFPPPPSAPTPPNPPDAPSQPQPNPTNNPKFLPPPPLPAPAPPLPSPPVPPPTQTPTLSPPKTTPESTHNPLQPPNTRQPPAGYPVEPPLSIPSRPPPQPTPEPPSLEKCVGLFRNINNAADVDYLIDLIDDIMQSLVVERSKQENVLNASTSKEGISNTLKDRAKSVWVSFLESGSVFLEFVNGHFQMENGDEGHRRAVAQVLESVGKVHWVVAGLAVVAFLLDQISQISENRNECIELLKQMSKLAGHIRKLKNDLPQEEKMLNESIVLIVEGSVMCASQLKSRKLFRFFKAFVDSERLSALRLKIDQLYRDLTLTVAIQIRHGQPVESPAWNPIYPEYAVGLHEQKKQVMKLLDMESRNKTPVAVVIYGFGGIGKTTLATAVIADLDLSDYNYSAIQIQEDQSRNDIRCMQQQILKDAFPEYTYDRNVILRNTAEGQDHLQIAFEARRNRPVFLFIDNALRKEDLQQLFPKDLKGFPKQSRIVLTTRNLGVTDMFKEPGLVRREHSVDTLADPEAVKILFRDSNPDISNADTQKVLKICAGIPLVLEIVGARLRKQNYMVEKCTQIFEALERGKDVVEENLSQRLVHSVYGRLEASTQEAFLDICRFFVSWSRRDVELIVGAEEVMQLEEAALFKMSAKGNLIVHDVIRAKALSMSESNRITDMQSWLDVLSDNKSLDHIKGVWLRRDENEGTYEIDENHIFSMKSSLRVLALGNKISVLRSGRQKIPKFKELRFLRVEGDTACNLWPENMESLERLAVFHGPVFYGGVSLYQLPKNVRAMKATAQSQESANLKESKPSHVVKSSSLEELDLRELRTLQRLPERLDHLTVLKVLILDEWDKMEELPEQVCDVLWLCKLSICGGHSLRNLPRSFGRLTLLEELILTSCKQLQELPSSFGDLRSLKHLNLSECGSLKQLPSNIGKLSSLQTLNLESCWKLAGLPSSFGQLRQLRRLSLRSEDLQELPSNFGELSSLAELSCNCPELKELPESFGQLSSLTHIDLSCCMKLKTFPSNVGKFRLLKTFNLSACSKLEELPINIGELQSLSQLDLRQCYSLKKCPICTLRQRNQGLTIWLPEHLKDT